MSSSKAIAAANQRRNFKSSNVNLSSANLKRENSRLKSTSMTSLAVNPQDSQNIRQVTNSNSNSNSNKTPTIHRPASRSALDSIHNGMNAKYAQIQSKVLLQNIRGATPSAGRVSGASSPATASTSGRRGAQATRAAPVAGATSAAAERGQLAAKCKQLELQLEQLEQVRDTLQHELEREKADKADQVSQLKRELADKLADHERHHEEQHRKLLEAYELADTNRRQADSLLSESKARDEDNRKRVDELEQQLAELKDFVAMKDEMSGKMAELRDQLRQERERYEEQLKSLHQVFENEKISMSAQTSTTAATSGATSPVSGGYFKRRKPDLNESMDSINLDEQPAAKLNSNNLLEVPSQSVGCTRCLSGKSRLHAAKNAKGAKQIAGSSTDMYGSRLSTRMQDTAQRAWRSTKRLASSVIGGGSAGISSCRARKRTGSVRRRRVGGASSSRKAPTASGVGAWCRQAGASEEHTNIVQVQSMGVAAPEAGAVSEPNVNGHLAVAQPQLQLQLQKPTSEIRVDHNNKLTIVTKFHNHNLNGHLDNHVINNSHNSTNKSLSAGAPSPSDGSPSESSGRGSGSDVASSAGSHTGDLEEPSQAPKKLTGSSKAKGASAKASASLLKALSASQHKLASLFMSSKSVGVPKVAPQQQQQQQVVSARPVPSLYLTTAASSPHLDAQAGATASVEDRQTKQSSTEQGQADKQEEEEASNNKVNNNNSKAQVVSSIDQDNNNHNDHHHRHSSIRGIRDDDRKSGHRGHQDRESANSNSDIGSSSSPTLAKKFDRISHENGHERHNDEINSSHTNSDTDIDAQSHNLNLNHHSQPELQDQSSNCNHISNKLQVQVAQSS